MYMASKSSHILLVIDVWNILVVKYKEQHRYLAHGGMKCIIDELQMI